MPGLRSDRDYEPFFTMLGQTFGWVPALDDPWPKVVEVQRDLAKIGHHRDPSPMDILIALTAEQHHLTVLHVDDDFAAIAKVRPDIPMVRGKHEATDPRHHSTPHPVTTRSGARAAEGQLSEAYITKWAQAPGPSASRGPSMFLESRTWMVQGAVAISTQELPSGPSL
jgi:hypothetical protein